MAAPPPPPPRRTATPSAPAEPEKSTWKSKMKAKGAVWGKTAMDKGIILSDNIGGKVNNIAEKRFGTEHFWPVTGDFGREMDKCARILRAFTVEGVVKEETVGDGKSKKKAKVLRKIPPEVIREAKGVAIFTSMRSGFAPLGGAGGAGVVVARLPDGSWSGPASISPNNLSTGFLIGIDVYDCVLIIRSQAALDSFSTHKATLGTEIGLTAGPYGAGAAVEAGRERAPVFSYVKSRGFYAGVELVGQVFVERFDENGLMYHWKGIKAGDILSGKVQPPPEAVNLLAALRDAETGRAQAETGTGLDTIIASTLPSANASQDNLQLQEGEVLKLPPTPDQTDGTEYQSDPETSKVRRSSDHMTSLDARSTSQAPTGLGLLPPPSHPSRTHSPIPVLPPRPPLSAQHSSQSHYSNAEEYPDQPPDQPPAFEDGPPGYDAVPGATATYPAEKGAPLAAGSAGLGTDTAGMSAGEKREWDEHWARENEEALRLGLERSRLDDGPEASGSAHPNAEGKTI